MNKKTFILSLYALFPALIIAGCSTTSETPVLEQNAYYQKVGLKQAEQDITQAVSAAKNDLEAAQQKRKNDIQKTTGQAATSVASGTLVRVVTGKWALGLLTGGGTRAGTQAKQNNADKETFRRDVERRLQEKGYQVKYWENL